MTIVKLHRRALVPVLGLALLLVPGQSPAAPGVGRVDVTPDHVAAGSTNTFKLTFTADTGPLQGQTLIDIPRGWSLPQASRLGAAGYVALARATCSGATKLVRVAGNRLTVATDCKRGQRFEVTYGPAVASTLSADGYVFLTQTKPAAGETKTKLVRVKTTVRNKKGKRVTKTTIKRVTFAVKPTFRPLAAKKQPVVVVNGGPVDHLTLNAPTIATAGTPFGITVRAEDVYGNTFSGYTGIVSFSSSDPNAFLPTPYQFTSNDFGAKTLGGVILRASGTQTITVSDNAGHVDVSNPITVYSF
ncbi:MAG: hypothetical protein E6G38_05235 [Actinobacteria bacterium]|nr:MAG: hypothetical protein E6G38_05235 [Actinomycetota bacterium]